MASPRVLGLGRYGRTAEFSLLGVFAALTVIQTEARSREVLLRIGKSLGLPQVDMNIKFQPEGKLLRQLWILSSAATLSIQIPVFVLLSPLWWVLRGILQLFKTPDCSSEVPKTAQFLLLLIPKKGRDNLVGDLEEEFLTIVLPRFGPRNARLWYWEQVISTYRPIIWTHVKKIIGLVLLWKVVK